MPMLQRKEHERRPAAVKANSVSGTAGQLNETVRKAENFDAV